jgi:hypothetical protein
MLTTINMDVLLMYLNGTMGNPALLRNLLRTESNRLRRSSHSEQSTGSTPWKPT